MAFATIGTTGIADDAVTSAKVAPGVVDTEAQPNQAPIIINGNMAVAQRSTSVSSANSSGYKAIDRYRHTISIGTWTISQSTDSPSDEGFGYSMKMDCTTAEASPPSESALAFVQKIEGQNLQLLKKGTSNAEKLTVAFWVKCTKTGTAQVNLIDQDNTRMIGQQFTVNATDTWEKKVLSFNADTSGALGNDNGSSLRLEIWLDAGSSYKSGATPTSWESLNTADYFPGGTLNLGDNTSNNIYITGVQLEVGEFTSSTIPPFKHETFEENLRRCQRYLEFSSDYGADYTSGVNSCVIMDMGGSHPIYVPISYNVYKRAAPTMTFYNSNSGATGSWRTNASEDKSISGTSISSQGFSTNSADLGGDGRSSSGTWKAESEL